MIISLRALDFKLVKIECWGRVGCRPFVDFAIRERDQKVPVARSWAGTFKLTKQIAL